MARKKKPAARPAKKKPPPAPARGKLTPMEWEFVAEYIRNRGNATQAYLYASDAVTYGSARTMASKLLTKVNVRNAINREHRRAARRMGMDAESALGELSALAYSHIGQVVNPRTFQVRKYIPPEVWRAIAQLEITPQGRGRPPKVKVRMHGKPEALDKVFRHLGLYKELPPLETILALLPPTLAAQVRAELAATLPDDGSPEGGGPSQPADALPEWAKPDPRPDGAGGGDGDPLGPDGAVPGDEVAGGPVAGELPPLPLQADPDAVLPPGGQVGDERGPDAGPLFDHP